MAEKKKHILGISAFYHDAAAALLQDGMLLAAAEEERFSRKKHDYGFPEQAIDFCLRQAGISGQDLDYVVFYEKPLLKFERILLTTLQTFPQSYAVFREAMVAWFNEKLWVKGHILTKLDIPDEKLLFVEHHLSHAASAFFCSPYEEAAILTVDGVGEWTTATVGRGTAFWPEGPPDPPGNDAGQWCFHNPGTYVYDGDTVAVADVDINLPEAYSMQFYSNTKVAVLGA